MESHAQSQELRNPDLPSSDDVEARLADAAERLARGYQHDYVGTEHLLQAVLEAYPDRAATFLGCYGVTPQQVRKALDEVITPGPGPVPQVSLPPTPRVQQALGLARAHAPNAGERDYPFALLLALAHQTGDTAAGVLSALGVGKDVGAAGFVGREEQAASPELPRPGVEVRLTPQPPIHPLYPQPVGNAARRFALVACLAVFGFSITFIGLILFAIFLRGEVGGDAEPAFLVFSILGVMAVASAWMAVRALTLRVRHIGVAVVNFLRRE